MSDCHDHHRKKSLLTTLQNGIQYNTCWEITEDFIPDGGTVVFDWDNTLKLYNRDTRQITSRICKSELQRWKTEKQCQMYVISAIYPSKINLETLLFEVRKLGLQEFFFKEEDKEEIKAGKFVRKGNIILCGYDKAETFLKVIQSDSERKTFSPRMDEVDGPCHSKTVLNNDNVVFFDDEEVNIVNFSTIVQNSKCFLVK